MDVHLPFCMSFFHLVDFFVGLGDKLHRGAFPDIQVKFLTVTVHNSCGRREQHDLDTAVRFPERVHDFVGGSKADILQNRPVSLTAAVRERRETFPKELPPVSCTSTEVFP